MAARSTIGRAISVGFAALTALVVVLHLWAPSVLAGSTVEDGVVEYLTAALFLAATVAFSAAALVGAARMPWALPLAAACFLVAGEEVSWGQRLLGVGTPDALAEVNVQGETNLHNIEGVHDVVRGVSVVVLVTLFALLPLAARHVRAVRRLVDALRFPVPPLLAGGLVLAGVAFMAAPRILSGAVIFSLDEVGELYVAAAWLVFALSTWTLSRTTARPGRLADLEAAGRERIAAPPPVAGATTTA